jgi:hypothetical protein
MNALRLRSCVLIMVVGILTAAVLATPFRALAQQDLSKPILSPEQQQRLALMKSKSTEASLTILPIRLAGKPFDRVTELVGLLLEQRGLKNIDLGKTAFEPMTNVSLERLAESVGQFVKQHPIQTDYALYAEINGNRQVGLNGLRAVVVDKAGLVVWSDQQTPEDIKRQNVEPEPMGLCVLLSQRLEPEFGLNEQTAKAAKPGKMAALMEERSGLPPQKERDLLPDRQKLMKQAKQTATLVVFGARVQGQQTDPESAANLVEMINGAGLYNAVAANQCVLLKASQADPNEQKVLWDLAREFRDYTKKNPPAADYALYADYVFNPQNWEQGFVHFVVCDRKGDWVMVDFQNSHQPDYQGVKPTSRETCDKLLFQRLEGYLR